MDATTTGEPAMSATFVNDVELAHKISEQRARLEKYRQMCLGVMRKCEVADDQVSLDEYLKLLIQIEQALATSYAAEFARYQ
jgi:hypothetical protein